MIKKLRSQGISIFLIEQNVEQTLEIADRGYVIENGRIVLEGRSEASCRMNRYAKPIWGSSLAVRFGCGKSR